MNLIIVIKIGLVLEAWKNKINKKLTLKNMIQFHLWNWHIKHKIRGNHSLFSIKGSYNTDNFIILSAYFSERQCAEYKKHNNNNNKTELRWLYSAYDLRRMLAKTFAKHTIFRMPVHLSTFAPTVQLRTWIQICTLISALWCNLTCCPVAWKMRRANFQCIQPRRTRALNFSRYHLLFFFFRLLQSRQAV